MTYAPAAIVLVVAALLRIDGLQRSVVAKIAACLLLAVASVLAVVELRQR